MQTAIYLRKSRSEEQENATETLARHKAILMSYADKHELDIVRIYQESIVSGDNLYGRPEMQKLLEDVAAGDYDAVLCMDIDRLGRGNMREQGLIIETFKYSDTLIITPDKTYNLNDDTDEELTEFKTFFARRELKTITKRLQRGLKRTIQEGGYVANAPFGYRKVYVDKKPTLEIVEDEAFFIRLMYKMYLDGTGSQSIAAELNRLGAKPRRSDKFNRNSVRHILKNPTFCGKVVWDRVKWVRKGIQNNTTIKRYTNPEDKWIVVDGLHPAIISEEDFTRAQDIRRKKHIPSKNTGEVKNSLAGLVVCGNCGRNMQMRAYQNNSVYLLCMEQGCIVSSRFELVEQEILNYLQDVIKNIDVSIERQQAIDIMSMHAALKSYQKELDVLTKQKNTLHNLLEQGVYTIDVYRERMEIVAASIAEAITVTESLERDIKTAEATDAKALRANIRTLLNVYDNATPGERNQLLKLIFKKIIYHRRSIGETFTLDMELNI